ncbi:MAG: cobalt-precorrin 5A hydrolase [Nitrospirales bacterium]|nr:cobalt-precorrin 5A hydrolase [Nitrospirales bacterium]
MPTAILYITDPGHTLAEKLKGLYPDAHIMRFIPHSLHEVWERHKNLIFIMATGIVVRSIASLLKNKKSDPAVVVLDDRGKFAISLLSGHLGGANELTQKIAHYLNVKRGTLSPPSAHAVITTSSDINGLPSLDLWAEENRLVIEDWQLLPKVMTGFINKGSLKVYAEERYAFPEEFIVAEGPAEADLLISHRHRIAGAEGRLYLRPRNIVVGIGCNSGTSGKEIEDVVRKTMTANNLSFSSIHCLATIDKKAHEPGLRSFAERQSLSLIIFSPSELNAVEGPEKSDVVFRATGAYAVSEPAAILASGKGELLVPKVRSGNVTASIALKALSARQ